jgi:hypothetical protein
VRSCGSIVADEDVDGAGRVVVADDAAAGRVGEANPPRPALRRSGLAPQLHEDLGQLGRPGADEAWGTV